MSEPLTEEQFIEWFLSPEGLQCRADAYGTAFGYRDFGLRVAQHFHRLGQQIERERAELFPILGECGYVPMWIVLQHERQAQSNHGQSVRRLAERGGLSPSELCAVLEDRSFWRDMRLDEVSSRLRKLIATAIRSEP